MTTQFSIPLYRNQRSVWREGCDSTGPIDVVVLELERAALPTTLLFQTFTPAHLVEKLDQIEVGTSVLIVGFPLGFHDTLHRLPVARQAVIASAFGIRFQGNGYFLTDARMHRGTSGAPVVARVPTQRQSGGAAVDAARSPRDPDGRCQPRRPAGRAPGPELRLVRRHPSDSDTAGRGRVRPGFEAASLLRR
jgi:hypothetical protein